MGFYPLVGIYNGSICSHLILSFLLLAWRTEFMFGQLRLKLLLFQGFVNKSESKCLYFLL